VGGKQEWAAFGLPLEGAGARAPTAGDRIDRDVPTCRPGESLGAVRARVRAAGRDICVVANERRVVQGLLREPELSAEASSRVEDVMELGPSTFRPDVSLDEMEEYFEQHELPSAPITTPDGVLVGLLRRANE
jgi:Mg/Co/Ni transporter MgtE